VLCSKRGGAPKKMSQISGEGKIERMIGDGQRIAPRPVA
jgi:hypothetical protein